MTQTPPPFTDPAERLRQERARRLFNFGAAGVGLILAYYAFTAKVSDPAHLAAGLLILALAALPALLWARRGVDQLPVFEVLMLTTANVYALPLLNSQQELQAYSAGTVTAAAMMVLLYQVTAILTHALVRGRAGTSSFFRDEVLTHDIQKYISAGLVLSTLYMFFNIYEADLIPYELNSVLRAVFFGIGLVCTFVEARRWGRGELRPGEAGFLGFLLLLQILMQFSTLFLVGGLTIFVLAAVGYVAGSHRIPLVPIAVFLAAVAVLHNGKSTMREKYWGFNLDQREQVSFLNLPSFYADWVEQGLTGKSELEDAALTGKLIERTSLLHILCLVAHWTPDPLPYLAGETYAQIPAQFVPRLFWPEKPPGHISTYTLSIYYGLQDEAATRTTTIGFGMIAEAYANFGFVGVGLLGVLVGAFYKKVQAATARSPLLSYPGLFLVVLMAWSFQSEYTLSIWISSFYQACVAVMGIPFLLRKILG